MVVKQHYGHIVNSDVPITGVLNTSHPEWLHEKLMDAIELEFEEHIKECTNEFHDDCYSCDEPTFLIGFKYDPESGKYIEDQDAEYSAIVGPIYTQVTQSKYVSRCALCSLCFPGQGDLGTPGEFLAYTLPPEVWGDAEHLPLTNKKEV